MNPFLTATSLLSLGVLVPAAILPRQSQSLPFPVEVVYLSNCVNNGIDSSEMDYYASFITARGGVAPDEDNVALINPLSFANWLGFPGHAPADFSSGALFFLDSISNVQLGQQAGAGHNDDGTQFTCFQESSQPLFTSGSKTCYAQWSCSHFNTVEFHTTNTSVGIIPTSVTQTGSEDSSFASNVFGNVNEAIQNGGGQSCAGSFPFGDGFSISFTCGTSDGNTLSALGQFFSTVFPSTVNITSTPEQQPTCKSNSVCQRPESAPFTACCNIQPETTNYTFPTHGQVTNVEVDNSNVNAGKNSQITITYDITSPSDSNGGCDSNLCQFVQGAFESGLDLAIEELQPETAILGILFGAACLACGESSS